MIVLKAMIMAAGVGSRLMPMTAGVPKPMIPMANQPLMANTVKLLARHGFTELIANLHYHGDQISGFFGDGSDFGVSMHYSPEEELLGTAGGVKRSAWFLDETFVIVSGDALTDIDLTRLMEAHRRQGALATIALKEVPDVEHFGIVIIGDDQRIHSFQEKPRPEEALSQVANTGIYVFEPEVFQYIPEGFYDFGKQLFPRLVHMGSPFFGVAIQDYWCDVGNLNTYRQAHADVLAGKVHAHREGRLLYNEEDRRVLLGEGSTLGNGILFSGSVVIGPGCRIEDNAVISDTVIWDNTVVGKGAVLREAVVGTGCRVRPGSMVEAGSAIASGTEF